MSDKEFSAAAKAMIEKAGWIEGTITKAPSTLVLMETFKLYNVEGFRSGRFGIQHNGWECSTCIEKVFQGLKLWADKVYEEPVVEEVKAEEPVAVKPKKKK